MARIKVKVDRGNGLTQVVTIDTSATQGARLGADLYLPNGQVATPTSFLTWLGVTPSSGGGSSSGPSLQSILTTKGDLATRDSNVQRLGIGGQDDALRVSAGGLPEWRAGAILSKVDDTNVTLTLTGTPLKALMAAAGLTLGWTGQLAATRGGTGFGSYTAGDTLYANSTTTLAKLAIGAAGTVYRVSGGAPAWQAPAALTKTDDTNVTLTLGGAPATALLAAASLTLGWTGTLAATRGGTGFGTYAVGDLLYASSTSALSKLAATTNGFVLTLAAGVPVWAAAAGGGSPANPTASVGLTAVNGVATTYLRSDGAPALDQGIAPTWTGHHQWTASSRNLLDLTAAAITYGNSTDNPPHTFFGEMFSNKALWVTGANAAVPQALCSVLDFDGSRARLAGVGSSTSAVGGVLIGAASSNGSVFKNIFFTDASAGSITRLTFGDSADNPAYLFTGAHNGTSGGNLRSGTYTPTITGVANVTSTTSAACQWSRVGNEVTVSGSVVVTVTGAGTETNVRVSLPIASALASANQMGGMCIRSDATGLYTAVGPMLADAANDAATMRFVSNAAGAAHTMQFFYSYLVV